MDAPDVPAGMAIIGSSAVVSPVQFPSIVNPNIYIQN